MKLYITLSTAVNKECAGKRGVVGKTIKNCREVVVQVFEESKPYYAYSKNVEHTKD